MYVQYQNSTGISLNKVKVSLACHEDKTSALEVADVQRHALALYPEKRENIHCEEAGWGSIPGPSIL